MAGAAPPSLAIAPLGGGSSKQPTDTSQVTGIPDYANAPVPGAAQLFGVQIQPGQDLTGTGAIQYFEHADPGKQAEIQDYLYRAGYYGTSFIPLYGHVRPQDIQAFTSAVQDAIQTGADLGSMLQGSAAAADQTAMRASRTQHGYFPHRALQVELTDPAAISVKLDQAFEDALGRKATDAEKLKFIASFQGQEKAYQDQINAAQVLADQEANQYYQQLYSGGQNQTGRILYGGVQTVPNPAVQQRQQQTADVNSPQNVAAALGNKNFAVQSPLQSQAAPPPTMEVPVNYSQPMIRDQNGNLVPYNQQNPYPQIPVVTYTKPDLEAQAIELARANPQYQPYQIGSYGLQFLKMMSGPEAGLPTEH